jgi:uncharacterized protein YukE
MSNGLRLLRLIHSTFGHSRIRPFFRATNTDPCRSRPQISADLAAALFSARLPVENASGICVLIPEEQSMSQAVVNPEELRAFAQKLKQFNNTLSDQAAMLASQLDGLSNTWRDQENRKFSDEFKEHLRLLAQFVEMNNRHIPYLLRKAERIDEYLQQR